LTRRTAVDLFAGCGGLSLGLEQAGFSVLTAVEHDPQAAGTYKLNHPKTNVITKDVRGLTASDLVADRRRRLDLIAGGPPCQGFSIKGQRRPDHPSNVLLEEFVRLVRELRPRAVLVENVVGLTSMLGGYYFDRLVTELERISPTGTGGYEVEYKILNAVNHGVPQNRRRLFVVALEPGRRWEWPEQTTKPGDLTLRDAIADLPSGSRRPGDLAKYKTTKRVSSYADALRNGAEIVLNHHTKRLEELRQERLKALQEGQNRTDLPKHLSAGGHETKYRRLKSSSPSPTVTAHMGKDLSDFIHPSLPRTLTVREAARIQGFPDAYEFLGSQASQFTQVGNAVPVEVARVLGAELKQSLTAPRRYRRRTLVRSTRTVEE
jgi:DNA (cytosine-5)-methyltransferase 1